ncbi:hypothetical protein CEXT_137191 [Caerostris extrusa]|uniref:Uncharacterized protein n=1 Tax=Caerostris extrusa TaxID=172846 RepID=A0AAV4MVJ7_CAEEX|nr:hypothetical protein CEXT_137191 [Caerostris extrusa]
MDKSIKSAVFNGSEYQSIIKELWCQNGTEKWNADAKQASIFVLLNAKCSMFRTRARSEGKKGGKSVEMGVRQDSLECRRERSGPRRLRNL